MINFFKTVRENLKDPKKRSLTFLGIYAMFFIFVFIFISALDNVDNSNLSEVMTKDKAVSSYEYIYKINDNTLITGTYKDDVQLFNYNNEKYYLKDNKFYLVNNQFLELENYSLVNPNVYSYDNIMLLIENSEFVEEVTYKDGSKKTTYNIFVNEYFNILKFENECNFKDCSNIKVSFVVDSNNYINRVYINLYNYYGYEYNIDITYSNINNIANLDLNYD